MTAEVQMRRTAAVLVILVFSYSTGFAQESTIRNFLRVNTDFCTAGQPDMEELSQLKDQGIRSVLNLRPQAEYDATEEEAGVEQLGMKYFNIPIVGGDVRDEQVDLFLRLGDDEANRPMFIHCASANRVGALWLVRRVLRDGWTMADAETEAAKVGLRSAGLKAFALGYIEAHQNR
jgi:uncharacterized protein (TIGR01244 family)